MGSAARAPKGRLRWLLRLYPRAWRARYGDEFAALLDTQPRSPQLVIDILAGAIDARLDPQLAAAPSCPQPEGDKAMNSTMRFRCMGHGPNVTQRDKWWSAAVVLGGTAILSLAWVALHVRFRDNSYVDSFTAMPFFAAMMLSMPFTYLKGRSVASQVIFIGSFLAILTALLLLIGFVTARM
jgi:hypothetical protein